MQANQYSRARAKADDSHDTPEIWQPLNSGFLTDPKYIKPVHSIIRTQNL